MRDWKWEEIESLDRTTAEALAEETLYIKGYTVYLIDFKGHIGYSAVVFWNDRRNKYLDEYELNAWNLNLNHEKMRENFIKYITEKVFTDDELMGPVKDYSDYERKKRYLMHYRIYKFDHDSMFGINKKRKPGYPYTSFVSFSHVKDPEIINLEEKIMHHLKKEYERLLADPEKFRVAIKKELENHEAGYTGDFEPALDSLGLSMNDLNTEQTRILYEEFSSALSTF